MIHLNLEFDILKPQKALAGYVQAMFKPFGQHPSNLIRRKPYVNNYSVMLVQVWYSFYRMKYKWMVSGKRRGLSYCL